MTGVASREARVSLRWTVLLPVSWLLAVVLVNPVGNFPLADDWSYGLAVRTLLTDHRFRLTDFTSMPLLTQLLWGWLFCLPTGFSFTALRASTLVAGSIGVYLVFRLVRRQGLRPAPAALTAAAVAFNPLYFALSFSFMTDVPFTVLMVAAIAAFAAAWTDRRPRWFWAGVVLTTLATLLRQLGLAVAVAASLTEAFRTRKARALAPLGAALAALALWTAALKWRLGLPAFYGLPLQQLLGQLRLGIRPALWRAVVTAGEGFAYAGLFTLPVQWALPPAGRTAPSPRAAGVARAVGVGTGIVCGLALVRLKAVLPLTGNILANLTLYPIMMAGAGSHPTAPLWVWTLVTATAVGGGALLVERLVIGATWLAVRGTIVRKPDRIVGVFLFGCAGWYLLPLLPMPAAGFYDRYLLPLTVVTVLLMVWTASGTSDPASDIRHVPAAAILAVFALFAVPATHDTLALNRARWQAVHWATSARGFAPRAIDGGFEVDGWYYFADGARLKTATDAWEAPPHPEAIVALGPVAGCRTERIFLFHRWLPPGTGRVYLLVPAPS